MMGNLIKIFTFANIINNSASTNGEVIFGQDMSGIKGFFSTVKMTLDNATYFNSKKELFAVSSTICLLYTSPSPRD